MIDLFLHCERIRGFKNAGVGPEMYQPQML